MAVARNMVIAGDFIGEKVIIEEYKEINQKQIYIKNEKPLAILCKLDKEYNFGVVTYKLIDKNTSKNFGDALIGGLAFGTIGAIIGGSVEQEIYTIAIEYRGQERDENNPKIIKDVDYKFLIEIDDRLYKEFLIQMF